MASIYERNGKWYIKFSWEGKRHTKPMNATTKLEAERQKKLVEAELLGMKQDLLEKKAGVSKPVLTVKDLADGFLAYRESVDLDPHSLPIRAAHALRDRQGSIILKEYGPKKLKELRASWEADTKPRPKSRETINRRVGAARFVFKWGVAEELVDEGVYRALTCLGSLRRGETQAHDYPDVKPAPVDHIRAVQERLPATLAALVEVQFLTGARPGELVGLRVSDIDTSEEVWTANPHHKNEWRGDKRTIYFGSKAQAVLQPLLERAGENGYLFSPKEALKERRADCKHHRAKPNTGPRKTDRKIREHFDVASYRRALTRACKLAKVDPFTPHQIRHTTATLVRERYGLQESQAYLGHKDLSATQIYAEVSEQVALRIAEDMG